MTRDALIQQIVLRMDEITPDNGLQIPVDGSDGNPLYELIDGLIESGTLELFSVAPYWRLPRTEVNSKTIVSIDSSDSSSRKVIRLTIGGDFLRFAEVKCGDFQRPITEVFLEQSPEGRRQHNRYLMGREAKPAAVMVTGGATTVIDCYSLAPDTTVTASGVSATYIAVPATIAATGASAVEAVVPVTLIPALEWLVAARAFGARGDANHAAICQQNAQNLIV